MSKLDAIKHVNDYPELITEENTTFLKEIVSERWRTASKAARDRRRIEIANQLKIPNNSRRNHGLLSRTIIDISHVIKRAVFVKERGLEVGKNVMLTNEPNSTSNPLTISSISRDFTVYLKGRPGGFNPKNIELVKAP